MAGLRDGLQHSRAFSPPRSSDEARDQEELSSAGRTHSAAQRARNIGFSLRGARGESAWKRRLGVPRTTAPTETTFRTTLLTRSALLHGLSGMALAGALTVIFLESHEKNWLWLIVLSMVLIGYGIGAYWCAGHLGKLDLARWLILGGDLALLAVCWLLLGSSSVLYLLFPSLVLLAAVLADRRETLRMVGYEALVLAALAVTELAGLRHLSLPIRPSLALLCTVLGSLLCLGWITGALLALLSRSERIGGIDHWNSAEIARVRVESDLRLRQLQDEVDTIQEVLSRAVAGQLHTRVALKEGELAALAAKLNQLLNRQEKLFDEGREHRRLERAVGELLALLEALHRGERVGWPAPTDTPVDRILALMRAPLTPRTTTKLPATPADLPQTSSSSSLVAEAVRVRPTATPETVAPPASRDAERGSGEG